MIEEGGQAKLVMWNSLLNHPVHSINMVNVQYIEVLWNKMTFKIRLEPHNLTELQLCSINCCKIETSDKIINCF